MFEGDLDPLKIIQRIEILYDIKINLKEDLIVFDEIQECPGAMTSLKYFWVKNLKNLPGRLLTKTCLAGFFQSDPDNVDLSQ